MKGVLCVLLAVLLVEISSASWYWPFGNDEEKPEVPRLSELMEPASLAIDEASDLASQGKMSEAVEKYRVALLELDKVESNNLERVKSPEFSTLRTKRAFIQATIDSLLLTEAQRNARPVAVSDTTELEKRLAKERVVAAESLPPQKKKPSSAKKPLTRKQRAAKYIRENDWNAAELVIKEMLGETPNDLTALNLRAAMESAQGDYGKAEKTLDQAISSHPRDYQSYYNMARLKLKGESPDRDGAKRYYDTGRRFGGPKNAKLEGAFK